MTTALASVANAAGGRSRVASSIKVDDKDLVPTKRPKMEEKKQKGGMLLSVPSPNVDVRACLMWRCVVIRLESVHKRICHLYNNVKFSGYLEFGKP